MNRFNDALITEKIKSGFRRWTRVDVRRYRGSWELRKKENKESRRINRYIVRQIHREINRAMDERSDALWIYYFDKRARFWDVLKDSRVELTEFVKDARHE
jgi:hypothetical protein